MRIQVKRLPFTMKSCLLASAFLCMLVFASFTKKDIQKVRELKKKLILKINPKIKEDIGSGVVLDTEAKFPPLFSVQHSINDAPSVFLNSENFINKSSENDPDATAAVGIYNAKEKQGIIGTFSDKEQDRLPDNFFTVDIPGSTIKHKKVYLEYDLFGLASHQSVPRSINHNIAIGGEIIIASGQWSHQKEEVNDDLLKTGLNTIMFTAPASGVKYKVKNVKFVYESASQPVSGLIINSLLSGNQLSIKGSYNGDNILINNEVVVLKNKEFEKIITLTPEDKQKGFFTTNTNGVIRKHKIPQNTRAFKTIASPYTDTKKTLIAGDQTYQISLQDASINIEKESTRNGASVELSGLREKDIPATTQGIKNITPNSGAYRLHVNGQLSKRVKLTIPYDHKRLGLISAKEIKTFYFDYVTKQWKLENSAVVDEKAKTVTIETNNDGDYINGVISVPESPQLNSFAPTAISGLKAGDPVTRTQHIQAPTANQQGTANISYPIEIPSGRLGMQPAVAISYDSRGGNGWMGEGWDISGLSSITVDSRWGTPIFDNSTESETYSLDGQMLIYQGDYLPHRHNTNNADGTFDIKRQPRNSSGIKTFYLRKSNDFIKIERYGNTPVNYRWIITLTNGTKKYYGGDENGVNSNAVLTNTDTKIVHWGITKEIDKYGNNIKYYYDNVVYTGFTGNDANLNYGKSIHVSRITYTGTNNADGDYSIQFNPEPLRPGDAPPLREDLLIDARLGVKRIEPKRLLSVVTYHKSTPIKTYQLTYTMGEFYKSLLNTIETDGVSYQLNYHNDITWANFGKDIDTHASSPEAYDPALNDVLTPSKISSNNTFEWGWSLRAGAGLGLLFPHSTGDKNFMVSGFGGEHIQGIKAPLNSLISMVTGCRISFTVVGMGITESGLCPEALMATDIWSSMMAKEMSSIYDLTFQKPTARPGLREVQP